MKERRPAVSELATGLLFPEGPVALPDGSVLVVEVAGECLTRIAADGRRTVVARLAGGPNGAAIGPGGKVYVCNNGGFRWAKDDTYGLRPAGQAEGYVTGSIQTVDLDTGRVETLYDRGPHGPLRGPNDLVFDRTGGFWFTDSGKNRPRDLDRGGVYYARADGSAIEQVLYPVWTPNGIGLSRHEDILYVAETCTGRLWQYEVSAPGRIGTRPWPSYHGGTLLGSVPGRINPQCDSLALDGDGNICVATLGIEGGVVVFSPDGTLIERVPVDDAMTSNICFGGAGLRTAYVTLAGNGRLISMEWPRPGAALAF